MTLEASITQLLLAPSTSTKRLVALADHIKDELALAGLPGVVGGSGGELRVPGLSREKDWDVAFSFAGKFRLLVSLKSMLKNVSGAVPNRLDDLQGELANVQQLRPELVVGYAILFDVAEDSTRKADQKQWSDFFEECLRKIAIRRAPLWNQGLFEALWFVRFDSRRQAGNRLIDPDRAAADGSRFINALLCELKLREPAVPITRGLDGT